MQLNYEKLRYIIFHEKQVLLTIFAMIFIVSCSVKNESPKTEKELNEISEYVHNIRDENKKILLSFEDIQKKYTEIIDDNKSLKNEYIDLSSKYKHMNDVYSTKAVEDMIDQYFKTLHWAYEPTSWIIVIFGAFFGVFNTVIVVYGYYTINNFKKGLEKGINDFEQKKIESIKKVDKAINDIQSMKNEVVDKINETNEEFIKFIQIIINNFSIMDLNSGVKVAIETLGYKVLLKSNNPQERIHAILGIGYSGGKNEIRLIEECLVNDNENPEFRNACIEALKILNGRIKTGKAK